MTDTQRATIITRLAHMIPSDISTWATEAGIQIEKPKAIYISTIDTTDTNKVVAIVLCCTPNCGTGHIINTVFVTGSGAQYDGISYGIDFAGVHGDDDEVEVIPSYFVK